MFRITFVTKIQTHILCYHLFPENRAVYEIMSKNMLDPGRPQMTIWRMRFACWITKATYTHSEYVISTLPLLFSLYLNVNWFLIMELHKLKHECDQQWSAVSVFAVASGLLCLSLSCLLSPQLAYLVVLTVNNSLYTQNDATSPDYQLLCNGIVFPRKRREGVRGNGGTVPHSGVGKASADTAARGVQITDICRGSFQNGFRSSGRRILVINLGVTSPIFIGRPIIDTRRRWREGGGPLPDRFSTPFVPRICTVRARWNWVVRLTLRQLYPQERTPSRYPVNTSLGCAPERVSTFRGIEKSITITIHENR